MADQQAASPPSPVAYQQAETPPSTATAATRRYYHRDSDTRSDKLETTSTLVLTSLKGYYVDIRLTLPIILRASELPVPLVHNSLLEPHASVLPTDQLDWAFAGQAQLSQPNSDRQWHCKWTHFVDSKTDDADSVNDEGFLTEVIEPVDVFEERTIWEREAGKGEDGVGYEEGWLPLPVLLSDHIKKLIPGAGSDDAMSLVSATPDDARELELAVLRLAPDPAEDSTDYPRGMVVRVGDWCQGVFRASSGAFTAERWFYNRKNWVRLFTVDDGMDPSQPETVLSSVIRDTFNVEQLEEDGGAFTEDGFWEILEVVQKSRVEARLTM